MLPDRNKNKQRVWEKMSHGTNVYSKSSRPIKKVAGSKPVTDPWPSAQQVRSCGTEKYRQMKTTLMTYPLFSILKVSWMAYPVNLNGGFEPCHVPLEGPCWSEPAPFSPQGWLFEQASGRQPYRAGSSHKWIATSRQCVVPVAHMVGNSTLNQKPRGKNIN